MLMKTVRFWPPWMPDGAFVCARATPVPLAFTVRSIEWLPSTDRFVAVLTATGWSPPAKNPAVPFSKPIAGVEARCRHTVIGLPDIPQQLVYPPPVESRVQLLSQLCDPLGEVITL